MGASSSLCKPDQKLAPMGRSYKTIFPPISMDA
jgi:hypothetical protein